MHPIPTLTWRACRRALVATLAPAVLLLASAAPVAADEPIDLFELEPTPTPAASDDLDAASPERPMPTRPTQSRVVAPRTTPDPEPESPLGYDVSWPQCNDELPDEFGFAVVGVNRGRTFSENDCLLAQLRWAGRGADVYLNTGNPGPDHSSFWPSGASAPREFEADDDDTADCADVDGGNAAADGYPRVLSAYVQLGWAEAGASAVPGGATWWLDVETANTWRRDRSLNVVALQGAVDYLEARGVHEVGFYSTPVLWWRVTRGTDAFDGYPAWHAGAHGLDDAQDRCDEPSFTGGELRMVQWVAGGLDTNLRCEG